ncbi:hypothetical protein DDB_G0291584 [Dictyostelium discoideum AX4]|nr:hypothetical protein DDB_G0291584 [Dictyostelium discoideum AX4]EAL61776.1 hypothetical protein DDB_G0291584 [Dictyostelium discoideum AX4]|eukprot:XP_635315.1 hypothetical protein DDB_G0291584 [Dictyostelium discoideum AX4]
MININYKDEIGNHSDLICILNVDVVQNHLILNQLYSYHT